MSDIVERLREPCDIDQLTAQEAADEIERLRAALREIGYFEDGKPRSGGPYYACTVAREALEDCQTGGQKVDNC